MEVFRISKKQYADRLVSSGSANRWNYEGQYVIYTASSRSLSTLELIVHMGNPKPDTGYKIMVISIADEDWLYQQVYLKDLPENWRKIEAYSHLRTIGSDWYESKSSLVLKVPSAIVPYEYNFIINTMHPDFNNKVRLIRLENYFWDNRLI